MSCDQQANNNTSARTKSKIEIEIEIEFERKLEANPRYREEYERFKEFQEYYKEMKGDFDPNDDIINILNEDYRKNSGSDCRAVEGAACCPGCTNADPPAAASSGPLDARAVGGGRGRGGA